MCNAIRVDTPIRVGGTRSDDDGRTRLNPLWSRSLRHGGAIIFNGTATPILPRARVRRDILLPLRQTSSALPLSALLHECTLRLRGGTALSRRKFCRCQRTFGELSVPLLDRVPRSSNHLIDLHLHSRVRAYTYVRESGWVVPSEVRRLTRIVT
jgi:hypothetical protein